MNPSSVVLEGGGGGVYGKGCWLLGYMGWLQKVVEVFMACPPQDTYGRPLVS